MKLIALLVLLPLLPVALVADPAAEVIAAEQARRTALLAGDATALAALLAEDLRYIHSSGKVETRADVLDGIARKAVVYERFDLAQLAAHLVTPDVAVLTGAIDQRKFSGGKWGEVRMLFHAVWRRDNGAWRQVSLQTLQVPAPRPAG